MLHHALAGFAPPVASGADPYADVDGNNPDFVVDFPSMYFRKNFLDTTFAGIFSHSRTGTADYRDSDGNLQTAADGEPRTAHHVFNGSTWVNEGMLVDPTIGETLAILASSFTPGVNPVTYHMKGTVSFADDGNLVRLLDRESNGLNEIEIILSTIGSFSGNLLVQIQQSSKTSGSYSFDRHYLSPGNNVPFNVAFSADGTVANFAEGGTAAEEIAADALPNLDAQNIDLFTSSYAGTISLIRGWSGFAADSTQIGPITS